MGQVLLKASAYVFVIALGYALKKLHFFGPNDYKLIMKIVLNITTPRPSSRTSPPLTLTSRSCM